MHFHLGGFFCFSASRWFSLVLIFVSIFWGSTIPWLFIHQNHPPGSVMVKWYWNDVQKMAFRDRSNVEKDSPFVRVFCSVFFVRIRFAWMELFCCFISFQILPGDAFLKILGRWNLPKLGKIEIQFHELGMKPPPPNVLVEILPQWAPTNLAFDGWNPPFPTYPFLRCQPFVQFFWGIKYVWPEN